MKVIGKVLFVLLFVVSVDDVNAQGVVDFRNSVLPGPPLGPDRLVRGVDGAPLSGTNFIAQLLYQDNTGAWVAHPAVAPFFTSSARAGFWNGGSRTLSNAGSPASGNYVAVNMQVRVWDVGFGSIQVPSLTF